MKQILLNPGPANTTESVKQAQIVDDICPREKEFGDLMKWTAYSLPYFAASEKSTSYYSTVLFSSSGTGAIEAYISSLPKDAKLLVITNGSYGRRASQIAQRFGVNFTQKDFGDGLIDYSIVKDMILSNCYSHAYMIHCETTTGVLNNIKLVGSYCKQASVVFAVDTISTFGVYPIEMDKNDISFTIGSSNKGLGGMAGISFVVAKTDELIKLKDCGRSYYFDLYEQWDYLRVHHQLRFTPPVQTFYALKQAIEESWDEQPSKRYERFRKNRLVLTEGMKKRGIKQFTPEEHASVIITSFYDLEHPKYNFNSMHNFLKEKGFTIYPGKVSDTGTFRISNIGTVTPSDMYNFLIAFDEYIESLDKN